MGKQESKLKEKNTIENTNNKEFSSLYIPTAVFERDSVVDETEEKAIMLSYAFQNVDKEWNLRTNCLGAGISLIALGIIFGIFLFSSYLAVGIIVLMSLIISGIVILIYGVYLKKPCKIKSLSKIYHISYILPYKSALLFDGCGVLTNKKIKYTNFKSEEIEKLYKKNDMQLNFENENELIENLKKMKKEISKNEKKEFFTPIISTSGSLSQSIQNIISKCEKGFPSTNLLDESCSIGDAIDSINDMEKIENDKKIFNSINELKKSINKASEPFIKNINSNTLKIEEYLDKINTKLQKRFFGNNSYQKNNHTKIPYLNIHQKVINSFEGHKEDILKTVINEGSDAISTIRNKGKKRKDEIKKDIDEEIEKIDERIYELEREVKIAYEKMIEEKRLNGEIDNLEKKNIAKDEHSKIIQELQTLKQKKEELRIDMAKKFNEIDTENEIEIEKIKEQTNEKLAELRGEQLNSLIKNRDIQKDRINKFLKLLENEKEKHLTPFLQRKNLIESHKNELISNLDEIVKERNVLLSKIKEYEINLKIEKPIRVAIPFWILELEHAKNNIIIYSPFKLDGKITSGIEPMFQLDEMKNYFIAEEILNNARKLSIVGFVTPSLEKALNSMVRDGFIPRRYYNGIKKMGVET